MTELVFHSKISPRHRRYTTVGIRVGTEIRIGVGIASDRDHFNKKIGRDVARGRALTHTVRMFVVSNLMSDDDIRKQFISTSNSLPTQMQGFNRRILPKNSK